MVEMASRNRNQEHTYIEGNTVRRYEAAPRRHPEMPGRSAAVPQPSREELTRQHERRRAARRNCQRAMAVTRGYVVFLTVVTLLCFAVCAVFVYFQANITSRISDIAALETKISELQADNHAAESRLETSMTLEEIKARAGELGLVYPDSGQIRYYSVESSDYMNQYTDVASR